MTDREAAGEPLAGSTTHGLMKQMSLAPSVHRVVLLSRKYRKGTAAESAHGSSMTEMWFDTG